MPAGVGIAAYDFRLCKVCQVASGRPAYTLPRVGTVYCCRQCGLHYLDHLDDLPVLAAAPSTDEAVARHFAYVDSVLQSNAERFVLKVDLIKRHHPLLGARCLDLGAGGGLFMSLLQREGAEVHGIEPEPMNRQFAMQRYGLCLRTELIEDPHWQESAERRFDVVTMWDVLEHVNYPRETLSAAARLLRGGGALSRHPGARCFLVSTG